MVIYAIFSFNSHTLHPGVLTVIPVLGTGMILFSATRETLMGRLLAIAPAKFFGKISYSLYLWHWPIMVLYIDYFGGPLSRLQMLVYVAICSAIAYLSFVFIEEPVRRQTNKKFRFVMISNLGLMLMLLAFAFFIIQGNGLPGRFNQQINKITSIAKNKDPESQSCLVMPSQPKVDEKLCLPFSLEQKQVLVFGDSFADHLEPGLLEYSKSFTLLRGFSTGCRPLYSPHGTDLCRERTQWFLEKFIPSNKLDVVILAGRWHAYDAEFLAPTIAKIITTGAKVAVLGPLPEYGSDLPRLIARSLLFDDESWIIQRQGILDVERKMRIATEKTDAIYISLNDLVCPAAKCQHVDLTGMPLRYDFGHLNYAGSRQLVKKLMLQTALGVMINEPYNQ